MAEEYTPDVSNEDWRKSPGDWDAASDDLEWERSIELKLSTQGKMIIGLGAGVLVTLALTGLQGKVVVRLVKENAMVIDAINTINVALGGSQHSTPDSSVPYNQPEKTVEQPQPNQEELEELRRNIEASSRVEPPMFNEGEF